MSGVNGTPFETFLTDNGVAVRGTAHHARLKAACAWLGLKPSERDLDAAFTDLPGGVWRARVAVDQDGTVTRELAPFTPDRAVPVPVAWAAERVEEASPARGLKTTDRGLYDRGLAAARADGLGDLLFLNTRGELAESAIANVFVELEGRLFTPPLDAGVLPGVLRAAWLAAGDVTERVVTKAEAESADALYLVSSLRGVRRCMLQGRPAVG